MENAHDDTIDAVPVFDVLQHVGDWELLFDNIKRILKPRGRLLLNPSKLSHPEKVDLGKLENILEKFQFHISMRRTYRLMHYKHFTEDEILLKKSRKSIKNNRFCSATENPIVEPQ